MVTSTLSSPTGKSDRSTYTYDRVGNRLSEFARVVTDGQRDDTTTAYAYDAADQLITESVDDQPTVTNTWTLNGTLESSTTATGTTTYASDLTDELVAAVLEDGTEIGYTHDARGNRTSRTVDGALDVSWTWDDRGGLPTRIGEYGATGDLTTGWLPDVTSATGAPLAEVSGGAATWMLTDAFANITGALTKGGTALSGTRTLGVFGNERHAATGSMADGQFAFSGQYLDDVTGLYDMRARDYDPNNGRFTAQDPVQVPTGMPYFASYVYGHNNPMMYVDPGGNWPSCNDMFGLCDSPAFAWNMLIGAEDAAVDTGSAIINPIDTYWGAVDACNAGFDEESGGTGATFEGFLKCVDNLNAIAAIRDNVGDSLTADCIDESGQSFGRGLFGGAMTAAPFVKSVGTPRGQASGNGTSIVKYDADFAVGQLAAGGRATASQLDDFGASQGWARSQTATGPVKYTDSNGVVRLTIKQGSARSTGSGSLHVELRNADGVRIDPFGNPVTRKSPGNHTPIVWDW